MKRLIMILVLATAVSVLAQDKPYLQRYHTSAVLDSTEQKTMYLFHPQVDWVYSGSKPSVLSWTKPDSTDLISKVKKQDITGDIFITVVPEAVTAEESDSLYTYAKPFVYEENTSKWYESANDSTFLIFGKDLYVSGTMDYLNWTDGKAYTLHLSGEVWGSPAIAFRFGQLAGDVADADTKLNITVEIRR